MQNRGSSWLLGAPRKADARALVFSFAHGGSSALSLKPFIEAAGPELDVIAVQLPGRGARFGEPFAETCDALLADLLPVMAAAIDRPYALFGHSVGAALAFAAAGELERRGEEPPLALFVSAFAPPPGDGAARKAGPLSTADWLRLSDHAFLAQLARFAPVDPRAWRDDGVRDLIVKPTRADFRLAETVPLGGAQAIATPIVAFGGRDDPEAPAETLERWRALTTGTFARETFDGGHFYFDSDARPVAGSVWRALDRLIAARPPSLAFGPASALRDGDTVYLRCQDAARATSDGIAVYDSDVRLRFAELDAAAADLHARLIGQGVRHGDLCGVCLPNSAALVVAMLAILRLGAAFFQIPLTLPRDARRAVADELSLATVVASPEYAADFAGPVLALDNAVVREIADAGDAPAQRLPAADAKASDVAFGVLSSGTTGRPKAILCTHRSALLGYGWRAREVPALREAREAAGVFFIWEVLRPLIDGRPVWVVPDATLRDPRALVEHIGANAITRILVTPSLLERMLALPQAEIACRLTSLETVILNGEVVPARLAARFHTLLPGAALVNDYSISETHDVTTTRPGDLAINGDTLRLGPVASSGVAMDGVRVYILDETKALQPYGVPGEVYVAGDTLAHGYLNAPEEMAERFLPDPFQPAGRTMFRTGDIGRLLTGGRLQVFGRSKFMVKLRGYSVVPAAVESVIAGIDGVGACALLTVNDAGTGQPDHLVAAVVLDGGADAQDDTTLANIQREARRRLPAEAVPARFVSVAAIPVCERTGKRDAAALRVLCEAVTGASVPSPHDAPGAGAADLRLAANWRAALGVANVAPGDNFFEHGGHSLKAADFAMRLGETFGRRVDVADIYAHPTFAELAAFLDLTQRTGPLAATPMRAMRSCETGERDIAVVGWACRFPGADSPEDLWRVVIEGRETHRDMLTDGASEARTRGPVLAGVEDFDAGFWGLSRREAILMDPQHRVFLELAWEALENAGHTPGDCGHDIGVFAGAYLPTYLVHHLGAARHLDPADPTLFHLAEAGNDKDYLASRTAFLMDLHGPAITVQTSCSTGLVTICEAAAAIRAGRCRMALAGAVSLTFPRGGLMPAEGHVVSPTGRVRTFDAGADGTLLGEGAGVVVLRPLADAIADGDTIHAVIKGFAVNNDGRRKAGFSAPSSAGQAEVLRAALADAGIEPEDVGYIEAHGTGTAIGDPLEVRALKEVYGAAAAGEAAADCVLGSLKPNIAHANIASGIAGFLNAANVLRHGQIPPLTNFETPNPELRLEGSRLEIATAGRLFPRTADRPRRAGVSSFGIGGTNAHLVLEEAPSLEGPAQRAVSMVPVNLMLSAPTQAVLAQAARNLADALSAPGAPDLGDVAYTLANGRVAMPERLAIAVNDHADAAVKLKAAADAIERGQPVRSEAGGSVPSIGRRVALPSYPFARARCWPDAPAAQPDWIRSTGRLAFADRFYITAPRRVPLPPPATTVADAPQCAIVLPAASSPLYAVAAALMRRLADAGRSPTHLSAPAWPVRAAVDDAQETRNAAIAWARAVREGLPTRGRDGDTVDIIVSDTIGILTAADTAGISSRESAATTFRLLAMAEALASELSDTRCRLWLFGEAADHGAARPSDRTIQFDLLLGAGLAIGQETARLGIHHVAIMSASCGPAEAQDAADALHRLIAGPAASRPTALVIDRQRASAIEPSPFPLTQAAVAAGRSRLARARTHVILGGLGRIGCALAIHLAELGCQVLLTSRRAASPLPDSLAKHPALAEGRVRVVSLDATDPAALFGLLAEAGHGGGLGCVFQCAGVADLRPVSGLTPDLIAAEFAAKVGATDALFEACERLRYQGSETPDAVVLFSSLAAELGGLGMAGYAAANRYLDWSAARATHGQPDWFSIAWDDWDFEYGKEQISAWARTRAQLALPVPDAIAALEAVLGDGSARTIAISASDLEARWRAWRAPTARAVVCGAAATATAESARNATRNLAGAQKPGEWPVAAVVEAVLDAYRTSLARPDAAAQSNYFDLGGDSLLAADVAAALDETLPAGLRPGIVEILEHPTPHRLAEILVRRGKDGKPAVMAAQ